MSKLFAMILVAAALFATSGMAADEAGDRRPREATKTPAPDAAQRRLARYEYLLRRFDADRNGQIEPNEVLGRRRHFFEKMVRNAGLDPTRPVPISQLRDALQRAAQKTRVPGGPGNPAPAGPAAGSPTGQKPDKPAAAGSQSPPLVPGFGTDAKATPVHGFGSPGRARAPASTSTESDRAGTAVVRHSSSTGSRSGSHHSRSYSPEEIKKRREESYRRYANSLIKRYDENKDGVLDKSESGEMRGYLKDSDRNNDGVITKEELIERLLDYSKNPAKYRQSRSSSASKPENTESSSASPDPDRRKTYRFLTPTERLPKGLPDWFARKDADGDGQVTMAEYASEWTDAKAEEFVGYDLDGDGLIRPSECLEVERNK